MVHATLLIPVAVVPVVDEQGLGLETLVFKDFNGIEDGGFVRSVGGMNADLGDDLGVRGVFVLGAGFGEIGLVADLLVVPVVMGVGVMRVGHGRALGVFVDLHDDLFAAPDDLLFGKTHKQGECRNLAGRRMIFELFDKAQHILGGQQQDFLVLTGFVAGEPGGLLGRQIAVAQFMIESAVDDGVSLPEFCQEFLDGRGEEFEFGHPSQVCLDHGGVGALDRGIKFQALGD